MIVIQNNRLGGPLDTLLDAGKGVLSNLAQQQIAANIDKATVYTAYSKPVTYTGRQLADLVPGSEASKAAGIGQKGLIDRIKPTVVVSGPFGVKTFAPWGVADPADYGKNVRNLVLGSLGVLAIFFAGGYYLGLQKGKRSR